MGKRYFISGNNASAGLGVKASGLPKAGDNVRTVVGVAAPSEALLNVMVAGALVRAAKANGACSEISD